MVGYILLSLELYSPPNKILFELIKLISRLKFSSLTIFVVFVFADKFLPYVNLILAESSFTKSDLNEFNILLLNPLDPGWDSSNKLQKKYIKTAKENNWECLKWDNGLELCKK